MATVRRLAAKRERIAAEKAAYLRQAVLDLELPDRLREELFDEVDRRTAGKHEWVFQQMAVEDNAAVGRWIRSQAKRPLLSFALWHELPALLGQDNEILATRRELADLIGTDPDSVTKIVAELEGIGALRREQASGRVRYFLSERILTQKTGLAREQAQASWPPIGMPYRAAKPPGKVRKPILQLVEPA